MLTLKEIFDGTRPTSEVIGALKHKVLDIPRWADLLQEYEPKYHKIVTDKHDRRDIHHDDGTTDWAARIPIGLEKLTTKRMTEFMFSVPVRRVYHYDENNDTQKAIADAIEAVYTGARWESENRRRGVDYFASCEFATIWFFYEKPNEAYGFRSDYKLKCRSYSPMKGDRLYPLFDERDDLVALSFEYKRKELDQDVTFFETYTADANYKWRQGGSSDEDASGWQEVREPLQNALHKIPCIYMHRKAPIWEGTQKIREDMEYTISRNSDVLAYNSAPVLAIVGELVGPADKKNESQRVVQMEQGGSVQYVTWNQAQEAANSHINNLLRFWAMQTQMPDISFSTMAGLGSIGYDARQTMFTDAHLKVGDESDAWLEGFDRETSVVKALLAIMPGCPWSEKEIESVRVEHIITPYIQKNEKEELDKIMTATGNQAVCSQIEGIKRMGWSKDPEATRQQILQEYQEAMEIKNSVMESAN